MAKAKAVEESKELQQAGAAGVPMEIPQDWGNEGKIEAGERLIPKLHLMQGQSILVSDGKAKMGDMVNLVSGEVLGDPSKPVEFIPIKKLPTTWVVYDVVPDAQGKGERKFKEIAQFSHANADWEWTVKDAEGRIIRENDYCINFLGMVPGQLIPLVVSFKRTSTKAGKKVVNHFDECKIQKVAPASRALRLISKKEMKNGKPYFVFDVDTTKRTTTKEEMQQAYQFYLLYKDQEVKVDNSDLAEADIAVHVDVEVGEKSQY